MNRNWLKLFFGIDVMTPNNSFQLPANFSTILHNAFPETDFIQRFLLTAVEAQEVLFR